MVEKNKQYVHGNTSGKVEPLNQTLLYVWKSLDKKKLCYISGYRKIAIKMNISFL